MLEALNSYVNGQFDKLLGTMSYIKAQSECGLYK